MDSLRARAGFWIVAVAGFAFAAGYGFRALTEPRGTREGSTVVIERLRSHGGFERVSSGLAHRGAPERPQPGPKKFLREGGAEGGGRDVRENPFVGLPREEIEAAFRSAGESGDRERMKLAAEALGPLSTGEVQRLAQWALASRDPGLVEAVAWMLVQRGGAEGIAAVQRIAQDGELDTKARGIAIDALSKAPPESIGQAREALLSVINAGVPGKLEFHALHAYGRTFEEGAVEGLSQLLELSVVRREAVFHAMRDFARSEDIPLLSALLQSTFAPEEQDALLRALGKAAGPQGASLLLGFLDNPPAGVRRELVGFALEEFAGKEDVAKLWERLGSETVRPVQAAIARAIARAGGPEEVSKLLEMATGPDSPLPIDSIAGALAKNSRPEDVPLLQGLLEQVRGWEGAEPLANEILRLSGKEGLDRVLSVAERTGSEEARRAIIEAVERFGDPSSAERLVAMFDRETDHGVLFHLTKALMRLDPAYGAEALAERLAAMPRPEQRAAVADALERTGTGVLVPALSRALRSEEDGRAQWHLARAIARSGPEGLDALGRIVLQDPDPARRAQVLRGLESAAPEAAAELARSLLDDARPELRRAAIEVLGRRGGEAAREELASRFLREPDPKLRDTIRRLLEGKDKK